MNPKEQVRAAYNTIATDYLAARMAHHDDVRLLDELVDRLPPSARVLDAGCGAGIPVARFLSRHFDVLGVDISEEQINLALKSVPSAKFVRKDITKLGLDDQSFDAVVCFYTLFHIPRKEHRTVLETFHRILKPHGLLLICLYNGDEGREGEETLLGATVFVSSHSRKESVELIEETGFDILWEKTRTDPLDPDSEQLFVMAQKREGEDR